MDKNEAPRIAGVKIFEVARHADARGVFMKPVESSFVGGGEGFGEVYVIHAPPGSVRGNHHHGHSTEWFCVISGRGLLVLEKDGIRDEIILEAEHPRTVMIPPGVAHAIKSVGADSMTLVVYWDRAYDPTATDTFAETLRI